MPYYPPAPSAGTGDVVGPSSATDNALVRFDATTGKLIQNSNATLSDVGALTVADDLNISGAGYVSLPTNLVSGAITTIGATQTLTNKNLTSGTNTFPTFNQNTTGSAATLTTSRTIGTLTGDVTSAGSTFNGSANNTNATVVGKINGVSMAGLATGILKNTTATGVPSIAVAGTDYTTPSSTETVTNKSISGSTNTLTNVGPSARTGGFFVGAITASTTLNTTGNKSITGVGFTPKLVRFRALFPSSATGQNEASGVMTSASQNYSTSATSVAATTLFARNSSQAACIGYVSAGSATPSFIAEYVSMDADGFTIHVTTANSAVDIEYECYA